MQTQTRAVVRADAPAPATAKQQIVATLAPRCPTPTQWTRDQQRVVGNYLIAHSTEPALGLLAPEWERLNEGAKACRG